MSAQRVYRAPLSPDEILAELECGRGTQWDPQLIDLVVAFLDDGALRFAPEGLELAAAPEVS
jgi:HD-GYP domain-containing protein (c-di-GMP phosphodiesterase class II)